MRVPTAVLLLLLPALAGPVSSAPPVCAAVEHVPFQGPSCRVAGGWAVLFEDGSWALTHGPDPREATEPASPASGEAANPSPLPPACVADPATQYHAHAIYAYPSDAPNRAVTQVEAVRTNVGRANAHLRAEAASEGRTLSYAFRCDAPDVATVSVVRLSVASAEADFARIVNDLRAKGYASPLAKYWVWYDGSVSSYCGQGTVYDDDRGSALNWNNQGNSFALTYRCSWWTMMHENGHNLGAVQPSAPHSSGGWHCNDGDDVMCYADGGSRSAHDPTRCLAFRPFDCGKDDYFDPTPAPGSHLATRWNVGAAYNRFLDFSPTCDFIHNGRVHDPMRVLPFPAACQGQRYTLTVGRMHAVPADAVVPLAEIGICWHAGATVLRCDHRFGPEHGFVPAGATGFSTTVDLGVPTDHQLLLG